MSSSPSVSRGVAMTWNGTGARSCSALRSPRRSASDAYRRNVQRLFVDQMDRLLNTPLATPLPAGAFGGGFTPPPPRPADARALARAELVALQTQLRTAALRTTDRVTKAHYEDLRARIDRSLNPPR